MKKNILIAFLLVMFALAPAALADGEAPQIVDTTIPVDADLRSNVEAWLGNNAPVPLPYWAMTYVEPQGFEAYYVSIAALDISDGIIFGASRRRGRKPFQERSAYTGGRRLTPALSVASRFCHDVRSARCA